MTKLRFTLAALMASLLPVVLLVGAPYLFTSDSPYGNALPIVILFSILVS